LDNPIGTSTEIRLKDDERVFRWVFEYGVEINKADGSIKKLKPSVFRFDGGLSLWAERLISEAGSAAKAREENDKKAREIYVGQVTLLVGLIRELQLDLKQVPMDGNHGDAHFQVVGDDKHDEVYLTAVKRRFVQASQASYKPLTILLS